MSTIVGRPREKQKWRTVFFGFLALLGKVNKLILLQFSYIFISMITVNKL